MIWFTWSREAMWARYKAIFEEFGVADERLAYMECSGTYKRKQPSLPGIVYPEPQSTGGGGVFAGWTTYGLQRMDAGFAARITSPNRGGPDAIPFSSQLCEVGDEWWLVGSKGDSEEVMSLEIQGSPLDERTKENLLYNLRNYRQSNHET
jgi:hypothetical protein